MTYTPRPGLNVDEVLYHIGWGPGYVRKKGTRAIVQIVDCGEGKSKLHLLVDGR
jgi:hypothetical protein